MKVDINGLTIPGSFVNSLHDDRDTTYKNLDINYNNSPISESQRKSNCKTFCEGEDENGIDRPCTIPCRNWKCSNCPTSQDTDIPETPSQTSSTTSYSNSQSNNGSQSNSNQFNSASQTNSSQSNNTQSSSGSQLNSSQSYITSRQSQPVQRSILNEQSFSHMEPSKKMAQAYGWSYIPPYFWSVPQRRPPACIPQKGFESKVASIYDKSVPLDALEYTEGGSILPKFRYEEEYNPKYYYPGWKSK